MKKIILLITICVLAVSLSRWGKAAESYTFSTDTEEAVKVHTLEDGVSIAVHYKPAEIKPYQDEPDEYADMILRYTVEAYSVIVYKNGFEAPGFTFANPDRDYCYDRDRTIDIYIADGKGKGNGLGGFEGADFLKAPCYDIVKRGGKAYDAVVLFPADYKGYLARWGAKDLNEQQIDKRIRASLYHEIFHLVCYSYNKNIELWYCDGNGAGGGYGGDWYAEGLARYFETLAGSYDNFFSSGFEKTNGGKITIFHGGANYLMEHPQESLKDARYDYSLFWAYLHKRYGMEKVEELSRRLRFISKGGIKEELPRIISSVLKDDFKDVLAGFAIAVYFKHFNPDIKRGLVDLKVMSLGDFSVSRDNSISSWASNFITLNLSDEAVPKAIAIKKVSDDGELRMNTFARLQDGRITPLNRVTLDKSDILCSMDLSMMKQNGVKELILIITNSQAESNLIYRLLRS